MPKAQAISPTKTLEIGLIYQDKNGYSIAIDKNRLVTRRRGKFVARYRKPEDILQTRKLTVEDICNLWKISLADLDQMTTEFLPAVLPLKTAPQNRDRNFKTKRTLATYEDIRRNRGRTGGLRYQCLS